MASVLQEPSIVTIVADSEKPPLKRSLYRRVGEAKTKGRLALCLLLLLILGGNLLGTWAVLPPGQRMSLVNRLGLRESITGAAGASSQQLSFFNSQPGQTDNIAPATAVATVTPVSPQVVSALSATHTLAPISTPAPLAFILASPAEKLPRLHPDHPTPPLLATSGYLLDADTGQVLYTHNDSAHIANASTTKIMTAIVALEHTKPTDVVTINDEAATIGESTMGLKSGERVTVQMLLYGLLLNSGNDAAVALADHIAGSQAAFVRLMNAKAARLGLHDTHFVNPDGLDEDGHYSSAHDLAIMAQYAMKSPIFSKIVATRTYTIPQTPNHQEYQLVNVNQFLWWYPGADGVKPGFTSDAGQCQVVSVRRHGRHLIGVVLHTPNLVVDTRNLMNWGFSDFSWASPRGVDYSIPYEDLDNYFNWDTLDYSIKYGNDSRYYPASGYFVSAGILNYYTVHGGPARLGLPRSRPVDMGQLISQAFDHALLIYNTTTHIVQETPR